VRGRRDDGGLTNPFLLTRIGPITYSQRLRNHLKIKQIQLQAKIRHRRHFGVHTEFPCKINENYCAWVPKQVKIALFAASAVASSAESLLKNALQIIVMRTARASAEAEVKRPG
jgi:hypothetical protein